MKLNHKGWSLTEMIVLTLILALFLFAAIYYIYSLYSSFNINPTISYYTDLEKQLENNASIYLKKYYQKDYNNLIITLDTLRNYNLGIKLIDEDNNVCTGYVYASLTINAYIKCPNYTTIGYEDNLNE